MRASFDFLLGPRSPGLHLHRLVHSEDHRFWSLRVNRDLRVIVHRAADELVLCYADHHDRAYAWAAHRAGVPGAPAGPDDQIELAAGHEGAPLAASAQAAALTACPSAGPGRSLPAIRAVPVEPEVPRPPSPRRLRIRRRAVGPLPPRSGGPLQGAAPAPLLHLLQFFHEAEAEPPPGPGLAPSGSIPVDASAGAAASTPSGRPGRLSSALARALEWLLAALARPTSSEVAEARAEVAEAELARLAAALDLLRRGRRPARLASRPAGEAGLAWAAIEALDRFLALEAGGIRALADGGWVSSGSRAGRQEDRPDRAG